MVVKMLTKEGKNIMPHCNGTGTSFDRMHLQLKMQPKL